MLKTTIVHHIYEMCIEVFFDNLKKNFPVTKQQIMIGDKYSIIHDKYSGEYFYDCTVIHPTELSYFEDLMYDDEVTISDIWLAIKFTAYKDDDGDVERYDSDDDDDADQIHFMSYESPNLEFIK